MLSFDITEKSIKIVKGSENGGKINVVDAVTIDIEDNGDENGQLADVSGLAIKINEALRVKKMKEKNAIVSIFSNQTIFKEMTIPKAKGNQFMKMVKAEMQAQLGIDDTYSISYIIIDEFKDSENKGNVVYKILATACPYEMIERCKRLFSALSISLKSVMIGCNSISKIVLSDMRLCMKMPLLVVQIDKNFLSINLYDDLKLAFSRFTDFDPVDYDYSSDYITQAVNENIFRMLQFQKTRGTDQAIENVVFYGDLDNIEEIVRSTEQMDLNVSVLNVPPQVKGCERINFSTYANAIGALFKRNKETEKINLLETDTSHKSGGGSNVAFSTVFLGTVGAAVILVGGAWFGLNMWYESLNDELNSINSKISASQDKKDMFDKLTLQEEKINQYRNDIEIAADAFKTHPAISQDYFLIIEGEMSNAAAELNLWAQIVDFAYDGYTISLNIRTAYESDPSQSLPRSIVEKLLQHEEFADVLYTGYTITGAEISGSVVDYSIQIPLSPIEPVEESEDASAENGESENQDADADSQTEN